MNLETGSTVGDYQIVGILGAGGMGKVFKVRNTISERIDAMKVLLPDLTGEPDLADRFLREIKVLASLNHPNIAGLRTALRFENQLLMIMEFVEGVSLDQRLQQGPLPVDEAVRSISQVLSALAYAHGHGVIHRDIKPANMMVTPDGTVKLMDFGIAKSATDRKLTMTGTTMGSLYYMSPEQIRGVQTLDARSDLYSVGVSLYELVTGKHPFDGDSQFSIMSAHLEKTPVPPITLDPNLPADLNDLILLSVNREADTRFQSADAFRNALSSVVGMAAPVAASAATVPLAAPAVAVAASAPAAAAPAPPAAAAPAPPAAAAFAPAAAAPAPAAAAFAPAAAAQPKKPHRALWATAGALCCVAILVALIQFGPWKKAAANSSSEPPAPVATPAQSPAVVPPPAPATAPAVESAPSVPAQDAGTAVQPPPAVPAPAQKATRRPPTAAPAAAPPATTPVATPAPPTAVSAPPAVTPPAQAPAPAVQVPPQPSAAQRAELQKAQESLVMLSARSASIHGTLDGLQRRQAASGYGLRGDWVQAASLMDSFLTGANEALAAGDAAAAKDLMEKGQRQVEILEKALNK